MRRRNETGSAARTSSPSMVMRPRSVSIRRLASRSSVVLPEPDEPTMARNSPAATASETSSTAKTDLAPRPPSKLLATWSKVINAASGIYSTLFNLPWRGRHRPPSVAVPYRTPKPSFGYGELNEQRGGVMVSRVGSLVTPPRLPFCSASCEPTLPLHGRVNEKLASVARHYAALNLSFEGAKAGPKSEKEFWGGRA